MAIYDLRFVEYCVLQDGRRKTEGKTEDARRTTKQISPCHLAKRPAQVTDDILNVLDADRQPHQSIADAAFGALFGRQVAV
jgi:hypothetical protein